MVDDKRADRLGAYLQFSFASVTYFFTFLLLLPTLLIGFLRLELSDGSYELAIAQRYLNGERLYGNIEFYTTPLSIYWNALILRIFPVSVASISVATLMSCILMVTLLAFVVYHETSRNFALTAVFFTSTMYLGIYHWPRSSYSWNAILLSALAIVLIIRSPLWSDIERKDESRFILIGFVIGAAIGVKQNIGVLVLAAFLSWIVDREFMIAPVSFRRMMRRGVRLLIGALAVPGAIVLELYCRDDLAIFAKILWTKSQLYIEAMSYSYFANFWSPNSVRGLPIWFLVNTTLVVLLSGAIMSCLVIVYPLFARWDGFPVCDGRWSVLVLDSRMRFWAFLFLASFGAIFPRAHYAHVAHAIPFCFAALAILVDRWFGFARSHISYHGLRTMSIMVCLAYSGLMTVHVVNFAVDYAKSERVVFGELPARGTIATPEIVRFVNEVRGQIRQNVERDASLLIAHPFGCFLYPFLESRNPTRYSYFFVGILNESDIKAIEAAIERGEIAAMLIQVPEAGYSPPMLYSYAMDRMDLRSSIDEFQLFVRRDADAGSRLDHRVASRSNDGG